MQLRPSAGQRRSVAISFGRSGTPCGMAGSFERGYLSFDARVNPPLSRMVLKLYRFCSDHEEATMALVPLATRGHYFHVYAFRVKPGRGDEFVRLFDEFDYSDANP